MRDMQGQHLGSLRILRQVRPLRLALRGPVADASDAGMFCAMRATIDRPAGFDAVPNHEALTMNASRRHRLNRTFEAIKCQDLARLRDTEGLVVVVSADIANRHLTLPLSRAGSIFH
jgi:hypothetical protein